MAEPPSTFEEFSYRGMWWWPGEEKEHCGDISYKPDLGIEIDLFDVPSPPEFALLLHGAVPEFPHGVTLLNCRLTGVRTTSTKEMFVKQPKYHVEFMFVNRWYPSPEEIDFSSIEFSFSSLQGWMWTEWPLKRTGEFCEPTITYKTVMLRESKFMRKIMSNVVLKDGVAQIPSDRNLFELRKDSRVIIKPISRRTFRWYREQLYGIRDLLSFISGFPLEPKLFRGAIQKEQNHPGYIDVYSRTLTPKVDENYDTWMAFSLKRLGSKRALDLLEIWFTRKKELWMLVRHCLDVNNNPHTTLEKKLVDIVSALEGYQSLPKFQNLEPYKKIKGKRGKDTYYERFRIMRDDLPHFLQEYLKMDDEFLRLVADTRNHHAHPDAKTRKKLLEGEDLFDAILRLVPFAVSVLYGELGFTEREISEIFNEKSERGMWLQPRKLEGIGIVEGVQE